MSAAARGHLMMEPECRLFNTVARPPPPPSSSYRHSPEHVSAIVSSISSSRSSRRRRHRSARGAQNQEEDEEGSEDDRRRLVATPSPPPPTANDEDNGDDTAADPRRNNTNRAAQAATTTTTTSSWSSSPPPKHSIGRWFGVAVTTGLIVFCVVTTSVRLWVPWLHSSFLGVAGGSINPSSRACSSGNDPTGVMCSDNEAGGSLAVRCGAIVAATLGLALAALLLVALVRVVTVHPGRVWYERQHRWRREVPSTATTPSTPSDVMWAIEESSASSLSAEEEVEGTDEEDPRSYSYNTEAGHRGAGRPSPAAAATFHGAEATASAVAVAARRCRPCRRPKPSKVHHCSRCGTCIDRMDHHCPWLGQCVGRGNHKYFILFLLYTALESALIATSTAANFIAFVSLQMQLDHHHHGRRQPAAPTAPPSRSASALVPTNVSIGKNASTSGAIVTSAVGSVTGVDGLLVAAFFLSVLFGLMVGCFFGVVWSSALDGRTQLDPAQQPHNDDNNDDDHGRRSPPSWSAMRRYVMGAGGSAWWWLVPTAPVFNDPRDVAHVHDDARGRQPARRQIRGITITTPTTS